MITFPKPLRGAALARSAAVATCAALLAALALPVQFAHAADVAVKSEGFGAGLEVRPLADMAELGLPAYPGAHPLREGKDDEGEGAGAHLSLWGGAFGLRLRAAKLYAPASVDAVARFYRDALARHGQLVDCSLVAGGAPEPELKLLRCGSDAPKPGAQLYKAGGPGQVRIVAIEPLAGGAKVQVVHLQVRGD